MKVAVVTGASRGIGLGIAKALSGKGFEIVDVSIELIPGGPFAMQIQADIADIDNHAQIVSQIAGRFGRIDVLVNNAGVAPRQRVDILETGAESFDRLMSINLRGPFFFTQAVANYMLDCKNRVEEYEPSVIFITSMSAVTSSPERAEYCISKAGLSMAAKVYADRLAASGIAVYEIRPGVIYTDMTAGVKEKYDRLIANGLIPEGRWGYPDDVGRAAATLACREIPYSTGAVIEISGGMNIRHL